ncbi:MAG: hypothetical protein E7576_10755 [Ruminococcaceae bacterium]|jgi:hypothetical protein|nr:hypothetical protein [Oscillospiraceae bacterium]
MKRICNIVTAVLFAAFLFTFAAAFVLLPDGSFSAEENRTLAQFPEFSWERLADGTFSSGINEYFADQFPARDLLVGIKGIAETVMLRGENNGVLLGKDGQLAVRRFKAYKSRLETTDDMDYYYESTLRLNMEGIGAWAEAAAGNGVRTVTVLPPRTVDVASSALSYPDEITRSIHETLVNGFSEKAGFIDLLPLFRERFDAGEYVYLRGDHHWTTRGAYLCYREIMKAFGMEDAILPEDAFDVEPVPGFYGTTWSRAGYKFVGPDELEVWTVGDEDLLETVCLSEKIVKGEDGKPTKALEAYDSFPGWMRREHFGEKDKYAAFLDGTHNVQTVFRADGEARERLLILKDSFANTLVPFLSRHFDLVILNLAGGVADGSRYLEEFGASRALIVYNWENLITNTNPATIK